MSEEKDIKKEIARLSHAIRGPISIVKGYLEKKADKELTGEDYDYLQASRSSMERVLSFIEEFTILGRDKPSEDYVQKKEDDSKKVVPLDPEAIKEKQILIVDDDVEMQIQWKMVLKDAGLKSFSVNNGEELLLMKLDFETIAAVIVDCEFENSTLNGFDVIEFLNRKEVKNIHMCTGLYQNKEVRNQAMSYGVSSIIGKPLPHDIARIFVG